MLTELHIKNLAILDQVELLLEPGFNVFTGETGAGKSMIVQAVHLLQGARASEDIIRTGAAETEIEARFEIDSHGPLGKLGWRTGKSLLTVNCFCAESSPGAAAAAAILMNRP